MLKVEDYCHEQHRTVERLDPVRAPAAGTGRFVEPHRDGADDARPLVAAGNIPNQMMADYYAQRAAAGLIVTEATQISKQSQGYSFTPGIHTQEQIDGWKLELISSIGVSASLPCLG